MPNLSDPVQAVTELLRTTMAAAISGLTVLDEWPNANQKLTYPSLTLFSKSPRYMALPNEEIARTAPDVDNKCLVTYIVGEYDYRMQLDLWCANKVSRGVTLGAVLAFLDAQSMVALGGNKAAGLSLTLTNYFNTIARLDYDGHQNIDDEAGAERQERRVKIDLLVNVRAIRQRSMYAIKSIQTLQEVGSTPIVAGSTGATVVTIF